MVAEANGRTTQYIVGQRISSREKKKSEKFGKSLSGYAAVGRLIGRAHLKAARGKEIGQQLGLSHRTIEHRVERLKQGFGARSTSQLVALEIADGLESAD
ncbi:hypothetical protein ELH80_33380 [Rhizobium ruizarguesonis]|uniref:HTH luxR-type domain-containing protein n=1 Tax=Rhizobium ruizarguesonis TaxID=2081791 RepID=A0AAE8Q879_9HYPH|nr:hypothetical protein [Rhizobium ruizarguesonis]MCB2406045.1 hypothetical protein [Rhizobium ruizarguesonis]NEI52096.1 hypothetical protein [Rhizobium ruizarguesonis]TAY70440.1 hypothetical protein ELH86_30640 [Rhizobium ruizarguesonis]TAZ24820.1 hypothetical protein ELH80_33380 [Rhizobium ruizarguesonis]TBA56322.1 hypothetical protein ELH58_32310 [Rhizobium ruizarguesonis]